MSRMDIQNFLEDKKDLQKRFLEYLDSEDNLEENFESLINFVNEKNLLKDKYELRDILYLILKISDYHQRTNDFFSKIERILLYLKESIQQTFSKQEVYEIFQNNKRIVLFLFNEEIVKLDKPFIDKIIEFRRSKKDFDYEHYFCNVFKPFYNKRKREQMEQSINYMYHIDLKDFDEKVKIGENDQYICQLIRNDSIDEFITYVNKNNIYLSSEIEKSLFETNPYLLKNTPNLIEYAAFFGSDQIFKYLYKNGAKLSPSLWIYSIHGNNQEIIQILDENKIQPDDKTFSKCFNESIKCHDIQTSEFIRSNFVTDITEKELILHSNSIKYCNYFYFPDDFNDPLIFFLFCRYNYANFVKFLLEKTKPSINKLLIRFLFFK